MLRMIIGTFV